MSRLADLPQLTATDRLFLAVAGELSGKFSTPLVELLVRQVIPNRARASAPHFLFTVADEIDELVPRGDEGGVGVVGVRCVIHRG